MKFYRNLIIIIILIIILLWFLQRQQDESTAASTTTPAPSAVATASTPAAAATPQHYATPVATAAPVPVSGGAYCSVASQAAAQARVSVVRCTEESGGWITVIVAALNDRNGLNDFLDACTRNGMKDLDVNVNRPSQTMDAQGRPIFSNTYRMRF